MLDQHGRIRASLGGLVSHLPPGSLASEVMPVLIGLDDILTQIAANRRPPLTLSRVTVQEGDRASRTLSLKIMQSEPPGGLEILVRDETEITRLEQNILQQRNELALANEALADAKQRVEAALREKSSFLANISHDLKTPLQVIIGNAEILRGDLPDEEREAFLQDVLDNSNFLLALITDLLDASALEADQLKLTEDMVDVRSILERILSMARQMPNGRTRHFDVRIDDGPHTVFVDPMRLQRLLLNVVSNAVKFTDDGGRIAMRVGLDSEGRLVIEIDDDGCGLEPALMQHVFEPFTMGVASDGSGLGLHIAKGLADLHDADLTVMSELGAGATVKLRLPKSRVVTSAI